MLVLTRKVGESIVIGDNVEVIILSTKNQEVRIGVEADRSISVHREEVYMRIRNQNEKE